MRFPTTTSVGGTRESLGTLSSSSTVGVAICDRKLRFRAINDALAAMNGIPAQAHLGKTIPMVLGKASEKVLPVFKHVFSTGQPVVNFELTAALPKKGRPGHWLANYLPIRNRAGRVQEICVVVLELTTQTAIEACVLRLSDQLLHTRAVLQNTRTQISAGHTNGASRSPDDLLLASSNLIQSCLSEVTEISRLLSASAPLTRRLMASSAGLGVIAPPIRASLAASSSMVPAAERSHALSSRERQVVVYLASGKTNKQIAGDMSISIRTVETYRGRLMHKLGLHSMSQLVRYAIHQHLIAC